MPSILKIQILRISSKFIQIEKACDRGLCAFYYYYFFLRSYRTLVKSICRKYVPGAAVCKHNTALQRKARVCLERKLRRREAALLPFFIFPPCVSLCVRVTYIKLHTSAKNSLIHAISKLTIRYYIHLSSSLPPPPLLQSAIIIVIIIALGIRLIAKLRSTANYRFLLNILLAPFVYYNARCIIPPFESSQQNLHSSLIFENFKFLIKHKF